MMTSRESTWCISVRGLGLVVEVGVLPRRLTAASYYGV
jgi:hypothetical protein